MFTRLNGQNGLKQQLEKYFIQISAVSNVIAKEALLQPIGVWPGNQNLNLPPNSCVPLFLLKKRLRCPP